MSLNAAVVVGYNVAQTLPSVLQKLPESLLVIVVDDGSTDGGIEGVPESVVVIRHADNRGYGAAQKTGYTEALARGAERVVLVHGDDQYSVEDCIGLLDALDEADLALGSRFLMPDGGAVIPWWRRWANRGLTGLANRRLGIALTDMHTGARAFRASALQALSLSDFSDDYVFDQQVLVHSALQGLVFAERPQRTRYDEEVQSISLPDSIRYGLGCVRTILRG
ncbi:MAG: glycosyltransferase family 2 protein [Myxococcota bacterium]|nr:glycosyltransferase family 2 protein [Myxococcota bacterium]